MELKEGLKELMKEHLPPELKGKVDPGPNLDKAMGWIGAHFAPDEQASLGRGVVKNLNDNPMFMSWMARTLANLSDRPLEKLVNNLILGTVIGRKATSKRFMEEHGYAGPITIVINPTMRCNIRCSGCYAYNYTKSQDMEYGTLAKVLSEAREMGVRFITLSGGEPMVYPHLFRMVEEFSDLCFLMYSNGTRIDPATADRIADAGNLIPAISVEGFEKETDARRGKGIHEAVCRAMENLRTAGAFFGFSATPTRLNVETISSDQFLDYYMDRGALLGWIFNYVPVGRTPDTSLMPTPEQRNRLREATLRWRKTKPIFIGDFWNDGACVGGCLSASRYCYISVEGYVQPCTFVHFYRDNVREKSLQEIFASDFFRKIREMQPYHSNLLRPCKIIDHPEDLRRVVKECRALPSYPGADQIIEDDGIKGFLDGYSEEYGRIADKAWAGPDYQNGKSFLAPFLGRINVERFFQDRMDNADRVTHRKEEEGSDQKQAREVA
jgi:MoaA/NifB/PqqE/SkfB family radical SAM enzyme